MDCYDWKYCPGECDDCEIYISLEGEPTEPTEEIVEHCECKNWARDNILLLTEHHPKCPKYNVEAEAKAHIEALLRGISIWANDEDGVHYQCFDAFRSAAYFIGKPELVKKDGDRTRICPGCGRELTGICWECVGDGGLRTLSRR